MKYHQTHATLERLRIVTKYGMSGICLLMTAHCCMLFFGYDAFAVHLLFVIFVMCIGIELSRIFQMCIVHKISIVYSMSVILCVVMRRHGMFDVLGIDIHIARGVMAILGIMMVGLNVWRIFRKI